MTHPKPSPHALSAEIALLPGGWARDVLFDIGADGSLLEVVPEAGEERARFAPKAAGPVVPGMPNLHSHAFQRAMAGMTERHGAAGEEDSFWTWRQAMYGFVAKLDPPHLEAIAAQLYAEMLKAGYTAVGEFHYLHHDRDGRPYADRAEMSERIAAAARATGIGLTLMPVLYAQGGFGGDPPKPGQARFLHGIDGFLALIDGLRARHAADPQLRIGIAPHSLRAVAPDLLAGALQGLDAIDATAPIHIHVAEQAKEVEDCLAWSGQRPVEWLLDHAEIGRRWCLVHATHMTDAECARLAGSGATAGLCPTTEANLGDGLFAADAYLRRQGAFGIGSDSNVSVSPIEELRWLEYGQRLQHRRRNVLATGEGAPSVGAGLYRAALAGGARALARPIGRLEAGARADLVVLDGRWADLVGKREDMLLDAFVFAGNANPVRDVMVGGRWVVGEGHHVAEHAILARYRRTLAELTA